MRACVYDAVHTVLDRLRVDYNCKGVSNCSQSIASTADDAAEPSSVHTSVHICLQT